MKKFLFMAMASLSLNFLYAQAPIHLESPEIAQRVFDEAFIPKITGKLLNFSKEEDPNLFIKYVVVVLGGESQETKTTQIDAEGNFTLTLTNGLPYQQIWLSIGDHYFGEILANKDLVITADLALLKKNPFAFYGEGIYFSGTDGDINTFVNQWVVYKQKHTSKLEEEKQKLSMNPSGDPVMKLKRMREIYEKLAAIDQDFIEAHPSSNAWVLENERISDFYGDLFLLHWGKEISPQLMEEALSHKPALISNSSHSYYNYLSMMLSYPRPGENAKMNQEVLESLVDDSDQGKEIQVFLEEYKKKSADDFYNDERYKAGLKFFKLFEKEFQAARTRNYIDRVSQLPQKNADLVKIMGQPNDLYQRKIYVEKILPLTQTEWCKKFMQKTLEEDVNRIAEIEAALKNTSNLSENHSLGENLLNPNKNTHLFVSTEEDVDGVLSSLLTTYSDKTLILDVWATWCGPCISDMKQSGPIKKELKELPVEVVYICVADGSDQEKWKKKVIELDLSGTHIFLNKNLSSELMKKFNLRGYPSYLFIDKDRNIDQNFIHGISRIDIEELKKRL